METRRSFLGAFAIAGTIAAQTKPLKSILGSVTEFRMGSLEIGVKSDTSDALFLKISPATEVVQVAPGERDLSKAKRVRVTDLALSDRVLVSFVSGMRE